VLNVETSRFLVSAREEGSTEVAVEPLCDGGGFEFSEEDWIAEFGRQWDIVATSLVGLIADSTDMRLWCRARLLHEDVL
jgi:hypothetical protein